MVGQQVHAADTQDGAGLGRWRCARPDAHSIQTPAALAARLSPAIRAEAKPRDHTVGPTAQDHGRYRSTATRARDYGGNGRRVSGDAHTAESPGPPVLNRLELGKDAPGTTCQNLPSALDADPRSVSTSPPSCSPSPAPPPAEPWIALVN